MYVALSLSLSLRKKLDILSLPAGCLLSIIPLLIEIVDIYNLSIRESTSSARRKRDYH